MNLEEKLGYFFFDKRHLSRALTRKAYALEQAQKNQPCDDQETYRMLGDAVLKAVLVELLIRANYTTRKDVAARGAELVKEAYLATLSRDLGIHYLIKLGAGEKHQRADEQPSVQAETLQAVLGGIYFDGGYSAARATICRLYQPEFPPES